MPLREMASDPKYRKVLVTDGKSATGQAVVRALVKAGADRTIADRDGVTPLQHPRARGYDASVAILRDG